MALTSFSAQALAEAEAFTIDLRLREPLVSLLHRVLPKSFIAPLIAEVALERAKLALSDDQPALVSEFYRETINASQVNLDHALILANEAASYRTAGGDDVPAINQAGRDTFLSIGRKDMRADKLASQVTTFAIEQSSRLQSGEALDAIAAFWGSAVYFRFWDSIVHKDKLVGAYEALDRMKEHNHPDFVKEVASVEFGATFFGHSRPIAASVADELPLPVNFTLDQPTQ